MDACVQGIFSVCEVPSAVGGTPSQNTRHLFDTHPSSKLGPSALDMAAVFRADYHSKSADPTPIMSQALVHLPSKNDTTCFTRRSSGNHVVQEVAQPSSDVYNTREAFAPAERPLPSDRKKSPQQHHHRTLAEIRSCIQLCASRFNTDKRLVVAPSSNAQRPNLRADQDASCPERDTGGSLTCRVAIHRRRASTTSPSIPFT